MLILEINYVVVHCWLNAMYMCLTLQFPDPKSGEWFGYLTQEGNVALDFKGGPFKGKHIS